MTNKLLLATFRGPSAAVFEDGIDLCLKTQVGNFNFDVKHSTRWIERDDGLVVPGDLFIQVAAEVPPDATLESLFYFVANAGHALLPAIAVSTNAAIVEPELETMRLTAPQQTGEYFQHYLDQESPEPNTGRIVPKAPTTQMIGLIGAHKDSQRLLRACMHYRWSLLNINPPSANVSLGHLWMALESMTDIQIRLLQAEKNAASLHMLADEFQIPPSDDRRKRINELKGYLRKVYLLENDEDCYKACSEASNGFEHGYMDVGKIGAVAFAMRPVLAAHVRRSILRLSGVSTDDKQLLHSEAYESPLACVPCRRNRHVCGSVTDAGPQSWLQAYPPLSWHSKLVAVHTINQQLRYTFDDELHAQIGSDVDFDENCYKVLP
jgi:hypothetical protein